MALKVSLAKLSVVELHIMDTRPLVSVLTACYNQAPFVIECLESIRNQTYKNIQLIILDDCSSDGSVSIIRDWITTNAVECIFIPHTQNQGVCRTFNEGLSHASGKYISMIAADDVWMLDKIENQVRQMEQLPDDVGVLYSDALRIDEKGNLLPEKFIEARRKFLYMPEGDIFAMLLEKNFIPAMTTLIRRSCYDRVGTYDENLCYEDLDLWLRISQHYRFVFSPIISAKYRVVSTSLTQTVLHSRNCLKLRSDFRMFSKCLTPSLSVAHRRAIQDHLDEMGEQMYKINCSQRNLHLWILVKLDPRPFTLCMFLFSICRLPYETFINFVSRRSIKVASKEHTLTIEARSNTFHEPY
jgi:glycosyltransferase involved in cell wall biosynthesis